MWRRGRIASRIAWADWNRWLRSNSKALAMTWFILLETVGLNGRIDGTLEA